MVNKNYPNTNYRVLQTMLIFTIAISFEIKAGRITKDKFVNIMDNEEYKAILVSSRVLMDNRQFYIKEFDNNYYYNFKVEYRFFKFIETYVRTRIFDMKTFKKNMEVIINTIDTEKLPGYKRLITEEYWKISDDQFPGVIDEVIESVKKGEIELIDTVKLFIYFSYFIKRGLIDYNIKEIKNIFSQGMNVASLRCQYCENAEKELGDLIADQEDKDILEVVDHFYSINEMLKDKMYKENSEEIFKCIPMKMDNFYEKLDREGMTIPIFKYYDAHQLFQRISCASNEDIVQIKEKLTERAEKIKDIFEEEIPNLQKLKQIIEAYTKNKGINIKIVMLDEFAKQIGELIGG